MSLVSTRSAMLALGVAVVVIVAVAAPARSWVSHRNAEQAAASQTGQPVQTKAQRDTGQYPDVDILVINDYSGNTGKANPAMVRIHMDIPANDGNDLSTVKSALDDTSGGPDARRIRIYKALQDNTKFKDSQTTGNGRGVVRAALGLAP